MKKVAFLLLCFLGFLLYARDYPKIFVLSRYDGRFRQLQQEISLNREREARRQPLLPLQFYSFCGNAMSLWQLAARLDLPYEAIATLNQWEHFSSFQTTSCILLPNSPGIAIWEKNKTENWTHQLLRNRQNSQAQKVVIENEKILFFIGSRFSTQERRLFLTSPFMKPIDGQLTVTSGYGVRNNPFTREGDELHLGVDLRARYASKVYAVADAQVLLVARNQIYGLYLILDHKYSLSTLYGHLSKTFVVEGQKIKKGHLIALSGNSGRVTGAHLHFSVYNNGENVDPSPYLGLKAWPLYSLVKKTYKN